MWLLPITVSIGCSVEKSSLAVSSLITQQGSDVRHRHRVTEQDPYSEQGQQREEEGPNEIVSGSSSKSISIRGELKLTRIKTVRA